MGSRPANFQLSAGYPQGSVLGPFLFATFINDLPAAVSSQTRLFADDYSE
jgi:hypothetical protein